MGRIIALTLLATALVASPAKHGPVHTKASAKTAHPHTLVAVSNKTSRSGNTRLSSSRKTHGSTRRSRYAHVPPPPSYQLHPDPERYQQIQQALADKGYFKGPVNGEWNDDSVAALRQFQTDQKLEGDGKLTALTLTGLGLGPKHDGSTAASVPLSAGLPTESPSPEGEAMPPPFAPQ
jgi:hypothetical protein